MIAALFAKWGLSWLFNSFVTIFEVIWRILAFQIGLPLGILIAGVFAAWYWQHSAVVKAVREKVVEITAKAEIESRDAIIRNNEILLEEKQKEIAEKERLLELQKYLNEVYQKSVEETNLELEKAKEELNDLRANPPAGDTVAPDSFIDSLRN